MCVEGAILTDMNGFGVSVAPVTRAKNVKRMSKQEIYTAAAKWSIALAVVFGSVQFMTTALWPTFVGLVFLGVFCYCATKLYKE